MAALAPSVLAQALGQGKWRGRGAGDLGPGTEASPLIVANFLALQAYNQAAVKTYLNGRIWATERTGEASRARGSA